MSGIDHFFKKTSQTTQPGGNRFVFLCFIQQPNGRQPDKEWCHKCAEPIDKQYKVGGDEKPQRNNVDQPLHEVQFSG